MADQKVVLVTGCAKGDIGHEYCKAFAEKNCRVFATDVAPRKSDMLDLHADKIETLELDVASDESVESAVESIISKCGHIDILINNAGIGSTGPLAELPLDSMRKAYEINALGQLRMVQQAAPHMASWRSGSIVNVGSVVGKVPTPWAGSYCACKAEVLSMSHTLRVELSPFNIDVIIVVPGTIKSSFGNNSVERLQNYEWKLYKDFKGAIFERAKASQGSKATDASVFARHVAKKVLGPKPPKVIEFGHMTGLFSLLSWSPLWARDLFLSTRFKLNRNFRQIVNKIQDSS